MPYPKGKKLTDEHKRKIGASRKFHMLQISSPDVIKPSEIFPKKKKDTVRPITYSLNLKGLNNTDIIYIHAKLHKMFKDGNSEWTSDEMAGFHIQMSEEMKSRELKHIDIDELDKLQREPTEVQSLIFSKEKFTREEAVAWAKEHDFSSSKVDEKEETFRLRQREPSEFKEDSFRTIDLTEGVQAIIGNLKENNSGHDDEEFVKVSKVEANYRAAESAERQCGNCRFFEQAAPNRCLRVNGFIEADQVCDLWEGIEEPSEEENEEHDCGCGCGGECGGEENSSHPRCPPGMVFDSETGKCKKMNEQNSDHTEIKKPKERKLNGKFSLISRQIGPWKHLELKFENGDHSIVWIINTHTTDILLYCFFF